MLRHRPGMSFVPCVFTKCTMCFLEPTPTAAALADTWGGPHMEEEGWWGHHSAGDGRTGCPNHPQARTMPVCVPPAH